jgi:hypothetical protein
MPPVLSKGHRSILKLHTSVSSQVVVEIGDRKVTKKEFRVRGSGQQKNQISAMRLKMDHWQYSN